MRILCVGANHKTAPLALREKLTFDPAAARSALETLRDRYADGEFAIVSTCNRSEAYVARPIHGHPREEELRAFFGQFHGLSRDEYDDALYVHRDAEAARHLFTVAVGLDSLVPGEEQILAQLKEAHRLAEEASAGGGRLSELFQLAFSVAREARTKTRIASGRVSVASVAVGRVREAFADFSDKCVLSVGAGKMNEGMLQGLRRLGAGRMLVANRSPGRAAEVAGRCGGEVLPLAALAEGLIQADVVVCSTGATEPIVTFSRTQAAMARRPDRPMLIIDIAVPRDVSPEVGELPGVSLYNIDDLKTVVEKNIRLRTADIDACRKIIDAEVDAYLHRLHVREVVPTVESLYRQMRRLADEELSAAAHKLTGRPERDQQIIRRAVHRALRRILHTPIASLRAGAGGEAARQRAAALRKLFNLPEKGEPPAT